MTSLDDLADRNRWVQVTDENPWVRSRRLAEYETVRWSSEDGSPWDDYDHWGSESPLKYVENASTPTLIHLGKLDVRVPTSQGYEFHMALKKLGVPTEFLVYPGQPHGSQEPRFHLVKMMAELGWVERWARGSGEWLD